MRDPPWHRVDTVLCPRRFAHYDPVPGIPHLCLLCCINTCVYVFAYQIEMDTCMFTRYAAYTSSNAWYVQFEIATLSPLHSLRHMYALSAHQPTHACTIYTLSIACYLELVKLRGTCER